MKLRPYQEEAFNAIWSEWTENSHQKTLLVLPTGCGKTIVFAKIAEESVRQGKRVLILAHREELLQQAADKIKTACGLSCAVEKAEQSCLQSWDRIVLGSVQTLQSEKRLKLFAKNYFDVVIIDEAHHAMSASYQRILEYFDGALVLGVTATPDRSDRRNLGNFFDSLAYEYTLPKAIKEGFLSPIKTQTIPLKLDLTSVSMARGDFSVSDLGRVLDPYLDQIVDEMKTYCADRKTVVFLPLIETSQRFKDKLVACGFNAVEVNGTSDDRKEILRGFDTGKYNVLCNSMLLTEGWDCPTVDCIIVLRPTKSRGLYCQMVGRGTRLSEGKEDLLLLDFLWHIDRHELCRPAHLIATDKDIADEMTKIVESSGEPLLLQDVEMQAQSDVIAQREESLAKELAAMRKKKAKLVDPLQFEFSILAHDLSNYVPSFGFEAMPVTNEQKNTLEAFGILPDGIDCSGKASAMIDRLIKRSSQGLSTPKQIRFLEGRGFKNVGMWSLNDASNMITRISAANWRIPKGITPATYVPVRSEVNG